MGLKKLESWIPLVLHGGTEVVRVKEGVCRWPWGHLDIGGKLCVQDGTSSSVKMMLQVRYWPTGVKSSYLINSE